MFPLSLSHFLSSDDTSPEKSSKFSLARLNGPSIRKSSSTASNRPSTANGSPQKSPTEFPGMYDEKPSTLRKRPTSNPNIAIGVNANAKSEIVKSVSGIVEQGVNIMDQIGEPDHTGWLRKKADRYNSWKARYFILKGPHLYFLRSNSKSVSCFLIF